MVVPPRLNHLRRMSLRTKLSHLLLLFSANAKRIKFHLDLDSTMFKHQHFLYWTRTQSQIGMNWRKQNIKMTLQLKKGWNQQSISKGNKFQMMACLYITQWCHLFVRFHVFVWMWCGNIWMFYSPWSNKHIVFFSWP